MTMVERRESGRIRSRRQRRASWDWVLIGSALVLSLIGTLFVASAGGAAAGRKQLLGLLVALLIGYLVSQVEPRSLRAWAPALYLTSLVFVLLAFTPLGIEIAGARAWVALPMGFTLQPSEFAKLALILALASTLAGGREQSGPDNRSVVQALGLAAVPIALIILGNDTGSALVTTGIVAAMMLVAGVSWRWLTGLAAAGAAVVTLAVMAGVLAEYQVQRLLAFLDPTADLTGFGLNTVQSRIAVGSGGLTGQGLFEGTQTQGDFVPVNDSDFIFSVVAEEAGLLGALSVILLVGLVLWRGWRIGLDARDGFNRLVAVGVVAWFGFQAFENIGMTLGITPVTGVTLPFVSYGGSSMIAAWMGIGLLQLVRRASAPQRR
ncbi:MAG: rod shape-determining protein RodA [Micrococcales bacterium]|nr:rod shape-determining protein RodA [Micrococcales bacterium]